MKPWMYKAIAALVAAVLISYGTIALVNRNSKKEGAKQEQVAKEIGIKADGKTEQAKATDARIPALTAKTAALTKKLASAEADRDAALKKLAEQEAVTPLPPDERDEVIAKDKVVIETQALKIDSLTNELATTTEARDQWKATADLREKQAMAQAAATDAWKKAVTTSRWQGRFEGAAAAALAALANGKR